MEIQYRDNKIRALCEKRDHAEKKLGTACARKLIMRLLQLQAAERVTDLVAGNPHPLTGDRKGQLALNLAGGWRLVLAAANKPCPMLEDGGIDWSQVTTVCIEYIGDYHD